MIGQVLEYAAYLWGMSFDELDRFFLNREGKSLLELLSEKSPIDKDQVKQSVEENLASGKFQLIIAVDAINPELEKIIAYVSSRGTGLQLEALELELYKQGEVEILVPQRYGQLNQPQESSSGKKILTFYVKPGTVGASFQAQIGNKSQPIFWAYPDCLQNALSDISKRGAPPNAFENYRQTIAKFQGFHREEVLTKSQPMTKFSKLTEASLKSFVSESQTLVEAWRKSIENPAS